EGPRRQPPRRRAAGVEPGRQPGPEGGVDGPGRVACPRLPGGAGPCLHGRHRGAAEGPLAGQLGSPDVGRNKESLCEPGGYALAESGRMKRLQDLTSDLEAREPEAARAIEAAFGPGVARIENALGE